jgi:hypothetical protein
MLMTGTATIGRFWHRHGTRILTAGAVAMALAAAWRLSQALPSLMWEGGPHPTDLHARHAELHRWFRGIFEDPQSWRADYPPATYVILWPLLGWLPFEQARLLWGGLTLLTLAWLSWLTLKTSHAGSPAQRSFALLLPLSGYATAATIGVGQLGNLVVPLLITAIALLLDSGERRWRAVAGSAAFVAALVKPALAAPFFWIVCFAADRLRPAVLVVLSYLALTLFAISFQAVDPLTSATGWLAKQPFYGLGHANLHRFMAWLGVAEWIGVAALLALFAIGVWVYRHRHVEVWLLMGVVALLTRLAFHHRLYDDVLLLIPMIVLFRLARASCADPYTDVRAGILLALLWASVNMPAQLLGRPTLLSVVLEVGQAAVWIAALAFLMGEARDERYAVAQAREGGRPDAHGPQPQRRH